MILLGAALAIEGRVMERGTGDPVTATLRWEGGELVAEGRFTLDLPVGTPVTFLADGYFPFTQPVPAGEVWKVWLRAGHFDLEVVVEARRDDPVVTQQRLDRERVLETPGAFEDPIRVLQALPGVAQTPEYSPGAGDVAIRGSVPGDNRYYLDGIELPYLYHFNQYSSVFHTRLLDELTLYPSTFGARWGDAIGGIIDTRTVWERPERLHGSVNLNPFMAGAAAEVPLGKGWAARGGGRRSFLDGSDSEQYPIFPVFWDWFGRVEHHAGGTRLGLVTFGAGDLYARYAGEPTLLDPWEQAENPVLTYRESFGAVGFQHRTEGPAGSLEGGLSYSTHTLDGSLPAASAVDAEDVVLAREDAVALVGDTVTLAAGGEVRGSRRRVEVVTDRAWPEVEAEVPLLGVGESVDSTVWRVRGGVYAEPRIELGRVRVVPGLRVDADSFAGSLVADPRASARAKLGGDTILRAGAGVYSQFRDEGVVRSAQAALGLDQAIAGRLELAVDGWGKYLLDGSGDAAGLSVVSRYRLREVFFAWASVDLGWSRRVVDGVRAPSDYDQPWAANLVASWSFHPTWNAGVRYRVSAGLPYTEVVDGVYLPESDSYAAVLGPTNAERLPTYMKIDLHLEKRFELRRATVTPYVEAWYVPAFANTMYLAWSYDYDDVQAVGGPGFVPLAGIRGEL